MSQKKIDIEVYPLTPVGTLEGFELKIENGEIKDEKFVEKLRRLEELKESVRAYNELREEIRNTLIKLGPGKYRAGEYKIVVTEQVRTTYDLEKLPPEVRQTVQDVRTNVVIRIKSIYEE